MLIYKNVKCSAEKKISKKYIYSIYIAGFPLPTHPHHFLLNDDDDDDVIE